MRLFYLPARPLLVPWRVQSAGAENLLAGVAFVFLGACFAIPMDALAKYLTAYYPVFLLLWARFFFHFLFCSLVALRLHGTQLFFPPNPWMQCLRGICLASASFLFFLALRYMPLADAVALVYVFPLILTALAPFVLEEKVGAHRWGAVVVGFAGACVIIRPGFEGFSWSSLLPVFTGLALALYLLLNRKLSKTSPATISLAIMSVPGVLLFTFTLPLGWEEMPPLEHLWLFPLLGLLGAAGHFFFIHAYTRAPAAFLAPFNYFEVPIAVFLGWLIFQDFPDAPTWTGIAILVASGLYILHRERVLARRRAAPPPVP